MKKFLSVFLIFCLCMGIPAAMAAGNETANDTIKKSKHGESGEVNPVNLAKLMADGVISEDDYNRMIGTVVENEQKKQQQKQQAENTTTETETPYQTVTPTAEPTQAATPEPTEEIMPEATETETVQETEAVKTQEQTEEIIETLSEIQETETTEANEPQTVQVEKGLIDQIIAALQGLLGV